MFVIYDRIYAPHTLRQLPGVDADAIVARLDDQAVSDAYKRDKAEARTAARLGRGAPAKGPAKAKLELDPSPRRKASWNRCPISQSCPTRI
jgi:hypothetical protein